MTKTIKEMEEIRSSKVEQRKQKWEEIKILQKDRKTLNSAISGLTHKIKWKKGNLNLHSE